MQQDEERRTKILLYGYSSEEDELSEEEGNTYSPIPDGQSDRPRPTSRISIGSKDSLTTISRSPAEQTQAASFPFPSPLPSKLYIPEIVIPRPLSANFDIYQTEPIIQADDEDAQALFTDLETPIEIATPILYSIPRTRPSMISIKTSISQITLNASHRPVSMPHPPPIPPRSERRVSTLSARSAISPMEPPTISLPSSSRQISDNIRPEEGDVSLRRPIPISIKSESALQCTVPSYDVFPQRSKIASSRKLEPPMIQEEQPQITLTTTPHIAIDTRRTSSFPAVHQHADSTPSVSPHLIASPQISLIARRTSSFPTVPKDPDSKLNNSPPAELRTKKSTSTLRQRRSSIGLALRSASSTLRSKTTSSRPPTSSSAESAESKNSMDSSAFPMPPPSPLFQQSFQQSFQQERKSKVTSSERSRISRVRTTIGL